MSQIYTDAILKASKIRSQLGLGSFQPINIYDACINLGITVRFVDVNMEGLYVNQEGNPTILISNQRPIPRRSFTCGHELGHHVFGHGLKLDILMEENEHTSSKDIDEILVDAFAAALLMPIGGIQAQFIKRNLNIQQASPFDFYSVCSIFGVGYQTLITHSKVNGLISEAKATSLSKITPSQIFKQYFGEIGDKSYFRIIDQYSKLKIVDLEVSNYVIVPKSIVIDGALEKVIDVKDISVYQAKGSGIFTAYSVDNSVSYFIRVQKQNYVGLADYRHFEN